MEYNEETYAKLTSLIAQYFYDYERILDAQDRSCDCTLTKEELHAYQNKYEKLADLFSINCFGKYSAYPVVEKTGKSYLRQKKVSDGKYEIIMEYVTGAISFTDAMIKLNSIFRSNGLNCNDKCLCCSDVEYQRLKENKEWLIKSIVDYNSELKYINSKIRDYELVHNREE